MNAYEEKQQAKKERYEELARRNAEKADAQAKEGWDRLSQIPFGQPILVGHHSEKADRAYRSRATGLIEKSVETSEKADYYATKAESVGTGGISQDDPDAIAKLTAKLAEMESRRDQIKEEFKRARAAGKTTQGFILTNLGANIRSVKERIERLEKAKQEVARPDVIGDGFTLRENKEENRLQFIFPGKPSDEVCSALKARGFRWSPINKAWQTWLNNRGRYQAGQVINILTKQAIA